MKKLIVRTTTLLVALTIGINYFACSHETEKKDPVLDPVGITQYDGGTHIVNAKKTDKPFIVDGATDYRIVTSSDVDSQLSRAVSELLIYINAAASVLDVPVVTDADVKYSEQSEYIVLGAGNALIAQAGLSLNDAQKKAFKGSGYRIVTKGKSIFVFGNSDSGTLFGVYDFLYYTFGVELFGEGNYSVNKSRNVNLIDFDITEIPDFTSRNIGEGGKDENISSIRRNYEENEMIALAGTPYHNTLLLLPMEQYAEQHPEWYATNGDLKELCFSAHGDAIEYQAMVNEMSEKVVGLFDENPDATLLSISQMDGGGGKWCECDACKSARNKYNGANSAVMIKFINDVSDAVNRHYTANGIIRDVNFTFLCYNHVTDYAPSVRNADGSYSAIDGLRCNDNVFPTIAHLDMMHNRVYSDEKNDYYRESLLSWDPVADKVRNWFYSTNFYHYMYPYDSFSTLRDRLKYALDNNSDYIFIQGQFDTKGHTGFTGLKAYVESKLTWNVNENVDDLYQRYFEGVYGAASVYMSDLFYSLIGHIAANDATFADSAYGYSYHALNQTKYWPKGLLDFWMGLIDKAYDAVSPYRQTDAALYKRTCDAITAESVFIRYALITLYAGNYSSDDLKEMRKAFKDDCGRLEIFKVSEGNTFDELYAVWGI